MIKVYESLQHYIANKKNYFTIPDVINLSYKKHALQLWEAEVKVYSNNIAVNLIDEWSWMDLYDNDNNYIGLFRVKKIYKSYHMGSRATVYKLVHAFSTMLDDAFLVSDTGMTDEIDFDSLNSMALINFMFSKQSTRHWNLVPVKYSGDNSGVQFTRQNGLLKYVYEALEEMGGKYSMIFNTTEYPWKAVIIEAKDKVDCRVREEYNLLEYNMDQDYAPYYNRLYVYGEKDILGAPIENRREPIKEPKIKKDMSQKQIDAAWKRYNEAVKKRKEEDTKRIADDKAAWEKYNADYKAWSQKQIEMQNTRDAALEKRRAEIAAGTRPSGGYFANLPPRPSTVPPPEKPHLQTRETDTMAMSIGELNGGKPYIEDAEEVASRGVVSRVVELKDIKDPKLLMDTAQRIFDARQDRTIDLQLTAIELNKILKEKIPFDDFHLGQHLLMQTKDDGNFDLVIVGESKNDVYGNPYDIQLEIVEVGGSAGAGSKPHVVSPTDMMLKKIQDLQKDILYARKSADGKNTIYTGEVEPLAPEINDIWYKTIIDPVTGEATTEMHIWNGVIWVNPFESLKQAMAEVRENEKELEILREEAEKSAKELEANLELAKTDLMKDVAANRETINNLNKELEVKLTDLQSSIDNANAAAEKAVEEAKKLLSGDIGQLKTELTEQITDEAANIESKLVADTDKKIASTKEDLLAQAQAIGDGVKTELNTQIGELSAIIAETKSQADGLTTKVSEVKQTVDGFSARLLESEETSEANKTKIAQIQNSVDSLSSTLSDITTTTEGMESRLSTVEQTSTELKTLIESTQENLGGKISNLNSRIETAEGTIATIKKTSTDNSTNISKINKRVSTAEGNISTISTNVDGLTTKTNTMQSTVDANKATIASQKEEIDAAGTKITTLTSSLTQTQDQVSGIITNYAKKTDLKGLATEEYTQTQIDAKAGEINQTISSQKKELDTTIAGINTLTQTDESILSEIAQIKTNAETESTKLNTLERDLSGTKSTVSTLTKDLTSAKESISSNTTQITQTDKKIQTIISDYAKKTDLAGYVNETTVSTIVTQKVGELTTTLQADVNKTKGDISTLTTKINSTTQTVDGMSSKIATYEDYGNGAGVINTLNFLQRDISSLSSDIQNKDYMSTINQQAGEILFDVAKRSNGSIINGTLRISPEGAYMNSGFIQTAHISNASITNAKILSLSADKLTAGTIDARLIRVTNLDAANITTGTISGARSSWNLNTGRLQNGWLAEDIPSNSTGSSYTSVMMEDGVFTFRRQGKKFVVLDHKGLQFWGEEYYFWRDEAPKYTSVGDDMTEEFGRFTARWWDTEALKDASGEDDWTSAVGVKNLSMSHVSNSTMTISYFNKAKDAYNPYIIFDNYKKLPFVKTPITVSKDITFKKDIRTANDLVIQPVKFNTYNTDNYASGIFLGRNKNWGLLISAKGVWWVHDNAPYTGSGKSRAEKKASMLRLNSTGDRDFQGGAWDIITDYNNKGTK